MLFLLFKYKKVMSGIFYALNILSINITNVGYRQMLVILSE